MLFCFKMIFHWLRVKEHFKGFFSQHGLLVSNPHIDLTVMLIYLKGGKYKKRTKILFSISLITLNLNIDTDKTEDRITVFVT